MNPRPEMIWECLKSPVDIVSHKNADVDGVACMIAFARELSNRGLKFRLLAPQDVSKSGKRLAESSGYSIEIDQEPEGNSTLIVDVLSPQQLAPYEISDFTKPRVVLDHHYYNEEWELADLYYYFDRPSCAEILPEFFTPDQKSATIILAGIITDTGMFRRGDEKTFSRVSELISRGAMVESSLELIRTPVDLSEKIAKLKAAAKLHLFRKEDILVVTAKAGSFESSVANSLCKLGADLAIVAAEKKEYTRVSVRSGDLGIHLGRVMDELGNKWDGSGGGHEQAAVMEAPVPVVELLNRVRKELMERL